MQSGDAMQACCASEHTESLAHAIHAEQSSSPSQEAPPVPESVEVGAPPNPDSTHCPAEQTRAPLQSESLVQPPGSEEQPRVHRKIETPQNCQRIVLLPDLSNVLNDGVVHPGHTLDVGRDGHRPILLNPRNIITSSAPIENKILALPELHGKSSLPLRNPCQRPQSSHHHVGRCCQQSRVGRPRFRLCLTLDIRAQDMDVCSPSWQTATGTSLVVVRVFRRIPLAPRSVSHSSLHAPRQHDQSVPSRSFPIAPLPAADTGPRDGS